MQQTTATKKKRYNPAQWVIKEFGGVRATAKLLRCNPSSVTRWDSPKKTKGLRGTIPLLIQPQILKIAKQKKLNITAEDLILGRKE